MHATPPIRAKLTILAGGGLLLWPALYNGWPLVFSDTGAFLFAALEYWPQWDKPIAYALFLHALSWRLTYWAAAFAQGLIVSHLVWLMLRVCTAASPLRHLLVMAGLAVLTQAPWFTAQLMPDFLAPVLVLAVVLLGVFADRLSRPERAWLAFLVALSAASHLSHLGVLAGLLVVLLPVRLLCRLSAWPRRGGVGLLSGATGAVAFLVISNALMWGAPVISPYGSVFPLARQLANGPAKDFLRANCPGFLLCSELGRIGTDSDLILWEQHSPLWAAGDERVMAPEAARILAGTVRAYPRAVALNALADAARQLVMVRIGDSLVPDDLGRTVLNNLRKHVPREVAPFTAARQFNGRLAILPVMNALTIATMAAAPVLLALLLWRAADRRLVAASLLVLLALAGNAVICGAASGPHHRYQARIAWLLPLLAGSVLVGRLPEAPLRRAPLAATSRDRA